MHHFKAELEIIGVNPFVQVPVDILNAIFSQAGTGKGNIPICGTINGKPYRQTLVKYQGDWRLYVNTSMLKKSPKRIGEIVEPTVTFDPADRSLTPHPAFVALLEANKEAHDVFRSLRPSLRHEIIRYIHHLKTDESVQRNIAKAIDFLLGKGRFVGRDKPR